VLEGSRLAPGVRSYRPPFEEFEILAVDVPASSPGEGASAGRVVLPANDGPMLLLVQRGSGTANAQPGSVSGAGLKSEVELKRGEWWHGDGGHLCVCVHVWVRVHVCITSCARASY
jgi:hypothetical protein